MGQEVRVNADKTKMLQATYSKGKAIYRSDNLTTIVILRDVISKIITVNQQKVHIACGWSIIVVF